MLMLGQGLLRRDKRKSSCNCPCTGGLCLPDSKGPGSADDPRTPKRMQRLVRFQIGCPYPDSDAYRTPHPPNERNR